MGNWKSDKLMAGNKQFNGYRKSCAHKGFIHHIPWAGCSGQQGSTKPSSDLRRQTPSLNITLFLLLPPRCLCWAWSGIFLGPVGISCHSSVPPSSLWEAAKPLALCKLCSAITTTSLCYQHCFQHKSKTNPETSYCEEVNYVPAKTSPQPQQNRYKNLSVNKWAKYSSATEVSIKRGRQDWVCTTGWLRYHTWAEEVKHDFTKTANALLIMEQLQGSQATVTTSLSPPHSLQL